MTTCPECGVLVSPRQVRCRSCGYPLDTAGELASAQRAMMATEHSDPARWDDRRVSVVVALAGLAGAVVGFVAGYVVGTW